MPPRKNAQNYRLLIALLLVGVIFFLTYISFRNYKIEKYSEDNKVNIILMHANWCGHCVKYLEEGTFAQVSSEMKGNSMVEFKELEYDANKDKAEKYGIAGFPSIVAVNSKDEKILDFSTFKNGSANRSNPEDIKEFVAAALASVSK